jgi:hypothetical protein
MGLMKWRKRRETLQTRDHTMVDQDGSAVVGTAMDDPVPDSEGPYLKFLAQPGAGNQQCSRGIWNLLDRISAVGHGVAARPLGAQPGAAANAVHLALEFSSQPAVSVEGEDLEFQT